MLFFWACNKKENLERKYDYYVGNDLTFNANDEIVIRDDVLNQELTFKIKKIDDLRNLLNCDARDTMPEPTNYADVHWSLDNVGNYNSISGYYCLNSNGEDTNPLHYKPVGIYKVFLKKVFPFLPESDSIRPLNYYSITIKIERL